jgi:hypothetical protein
MLKKIIVIFTVFFTMLSIVSIAYTQGDYGLANAGKRAGYTTSQSDIYKIINLAVNVGLSVLFIAFLGIMFYAGLRWMTARGNEELSSKAKTALEAGIIGLIVVLSAYAISNFVLSKLTWTGKVINATGTCESKGGTCMASCVSPKIISTYDCSKSTDYCCVDDD